MILIPMLNLLLNQRQSRAKTQSTNRTKDTNHQLGSLAERIDLSRGLESTQQLLSLVVILFGLGDLCICIPVELGHGEVALAVVFLPVAGLGLVLCAQLKSCRVQDRCDGEAVAKVVDCFAGCPKKKNIARGSQVRESVE